MLMFSNLNTTHISLDTLLENTNLDQKKVIFFFFFFPSKWYNSDEIQCLGIGLISFFLRKVKLYYCRHHLNHSFIVERKWHNKNSRYEKKQCMIFYTTYMMKATFMVRWVGIFINFILEVYNVKFNCNAWSNNRHSKFFLLRCTFLLQSYSIASSMFSLLHVIFLPF